MKITVTGSLGNISRILIAKLVAHGHQVKVISSNPERIQDIQQLKASPLIGSVEDYEFVKKSFQGSDAVYLMIPPNFRTTDIKQYIKKVGGQYAKALKENAIKYAVNLSSIGSHLADGLGPTGANYFAEQQLNALDTHVLHLRPGMFMSNFYGAIGMMKHQHILGNNFEGDITLPLTHPADIADAAFRALDNPSFSGKQIQYLVSDEKNGFEVAELLGNAIGKPAINWVAFSDEQLLNVLVKNGFSEQMASVYMVEIGIALKDGTFMEDYNKHRSSSADKTTFQDFAKEFSMVYQFNN